MIADLNAEKGEALAGELGDAARFVEADVTDAEAVAAAVDARGRGDGGLRIAVCCAGIGWAERVAGKGGPHASSCSRTSSRSTWSARSTCCAWPPPAMSENEPDEEGERGVFVNTASIAAFDGQIGQIAYSASKGGDRRHDPAGGARPGERAASG